MMPDWTTRFLELAVRYQALRFGQFTLKSGRLSPYFFNAGAFCDGCSLDQLARCYAEAIAASGLRFDLVFGPAYKGIALAALVAAALQRDHGINVGFAYNRKEAKDHGEGGVLVGAPLQGRALIIDDVISAGTAIGESLDLIRSAGADPVGVVIALDRQERGADQRSAAQSLRAGGLEVVSIARLDDLVAWLEQCGQDPDALGRMRDYRTRYGVEPA